MPIELPPYSNEYLQHADDFTKDRIRINFDYKLTNKNTNPRSAAYSYRSNNTSWSRNYQNNQKTEPSFSPICGKYWYCCNTDSIRSLSIQRPEGFSKEIHRNFDLWEVKSGDDEYLRSLLLCAWTSSLAFSTFNGIFSDSRCHPLTNANRIPARTSSTAFLLVHRRRPSSFTSCFSSAYCAAF